MTRSFLTTFLIFFFLIAPVALGVSDGMTFTPEVAHAQYGSAAGGGSGADAEGSGGIFSFSFNSLLAHLGNAVLALFGGVLGIAGNALNVALEITVLKFNTLMGSGGETGITTAWELLRDIANIAFIGILVFIGIATILQIEEYGYQKLLVRVIIAALLVNFSLFFTQIVIDGTNLMAAETYQMITTGECNEGAIDEGISCRFMEEFQLASIYNTEAGEGAQESVLGGQSAWNIFIITVLGSIFFLIAAFVFLAAALMLVSRFVVLIFLMIISPLAFAAFVLPKTQPQAKKWWSTLISQGLFAPFFLLFVWASLEIIRELGSAIPQALNVEGVAESEKSFATALSSAGVDTAGIFINFAIVAGLLIASLIMAKRLGIGGADSAISYGRDLGGRALGGAGRAFGGATFGATGRFLRRTAGRAGFKTSQREGLQEAASQGGATGFGARQAMRGAEGAASSSFDLRNVGGGAAGRATGTGSGLSGGFKQQVEEGAEQRAGFARQSLGTDKQRRQYAQTLETQSGGRVRQATGTADIDKAGADKIRKEFGGESQILDSISQE